MYLKLLAILLLSLAPLLAGCRSSGSEGRPQNPLGQQTGGGASERVVGEGVEPFFNAHVQPLLTYCRTCHIPGQSGDVDGGSRFMLSTATAEDFSLMYASWKALGEGVEDNAILTQTSDSTAGHTGGTPWGADSTAYKAVASVLRCWEAPSSCAFGQPGPVPTEHPLLGSVRGGHFWDDFCNGLVTAKGARLLDSEGRYLTKANAVPLPDSEPIPQDPRDLVRAGVSDGKHVYFNAFWRDCHVVPELVNEFPHPKNCGSYRASIARGSIIMGTAPEVDSAGQPYTCGVNEPYETSVPSIYKGHRDEGRIIRKGTTFAGDAPHGVAALTARQLNSLWSTWGLSARPENFDELMAERYGFGQPSEQFPYPIIDQAKGIDETTMLSRTFGGTGRLPFGMVQTRLKDGRYSGEISTNCQGCHGSQVGGEFIVGAGGGMLDATVSSRDFAAMGSAAGIAIDRAGLAGRVRGTNNAQFSNITALAGLSGGDLSILPDILQNGTTGTGDTPAWWNVGKRPVKFVDAMFSGDAVRVDFALFSPLLTNKYGPFGEDPDYDFGPWVSGHVQDGDHYITSRKAPEYPLPINEALAKQGAILFHTKNLWAGENIVPKPKGGNGSCASCHGAYSPRFVNDPAFLADPRLEGIASYVVPLEIIGTDPVRMETYNEGTNQGNSRTSVGYPETAPDSPERMALDNELAAQVEDCRVQNLAGLQKDSANSQRPRGYAAPPLYGIWATAPYLHNGSVPTVAAVLDSSARPEIWRRVSKPAPAGQMNVVMGFDHNLQRAYDQQAMGWRYDELECGGGDILPQQDCTPLAQDGADFFLSEYYGGLLLGWNITNPPTLTNDDIEARKIYNTRMFSQSNSGHEFSDVLTTQERQAIIEYLKTL